MNVFLINLIAGFTDAFLGYNTFKMYHKNHLTSKLMTSIGLVLSYAFIAELGNFAEAFNPLDIFPIAHPVLQFGSAK